MWSWYTGHWYIKVDCYIWYCEDSPSINGQSPYCCIMVRCSAVLMRPSNGWSVTSCCSCTLSCSNLSIVTSRHVAGISCDTGNVTLWYMAYVAYIAAQPAWNDLDWRQRLRGGGAENDGHEKYGPEIDGWAEVNAWQWVRPTSVLIVRVASRLF